MLDQFSQEMERGFFMIFMICYDSRLFYENLYLYTNLRFVPGKKNSLIIFCNNYTFLLPRKLKIFLW